MKLYYKALELAYPLLQFKNKLMNNNQGRLRIFLYHDIQPDEVELFEKQIKWLSKKWTFITPQEFEAILTDGKPLEQDSILLTFDDGFYSNLIVTEKVLEPLGIKAIFFVVSQFASLLDKDSSYQFIAKNIFPNLHITEIPEHWYNLKWCELKNLHASGHTIGGHTATHAKLSEITDILELKNEIVSSANVIEEQLDIKIKHFAYTFGDLGSINQDALNIAKERYDFVYSGLRGLNTTKTSPYALRRDSISPRDTLPLIGAFLEGGADLRYRRSRVVLDEWAINKPE